MKQLSLRQPCSKLLIWLNYSVKLTQLVLEPTTTMADRKTGLRPMREKELTVTPPV